MPLYSKFNLVRMSYIKTNRDMEKYNRISSKSLNIVKKILDTSDNNSSYDLGDMGRSMSAALGSEPPVSSQSSWKELKNRMQKDKSFTQIRQQYIWIRVAASILVLVILSISSFFIFKERQVKEYAMGGSMEPLDMPVKISSGMDSQVLPDGSRIWMDAVSRVTVHGDITKDSVRQIYAEGDVFFDVAHDPRRPMIVYTSRCVITVLGTKFHLHDYLSEPELILTLYEGCIKVTGENLNYVMKPGQEVRINHQTGRLSLVDHNDEEPKDAPVGYIHGQLNDMKNEKVLVTVMDRQFKGSNTDTIQLKRGKFNLKMQYSSARLVSITTLRTAGSKGLPMQATFYYLPGQNVTLQGSLDDPILMGDEFCRQQNAIFKQVYKPSKQQYIELIKKSYSDDGDSYSRDNQSYEQWKAEREAMSLAFMKAHPDWDASAGLLYDIRIDHLNEALSILDDNVKDGPLQPLVDVKIKALKHHQQQERARQLTQSGRPAPDFELRDHNGRIVRLSDYHGKYVILDFWASWCNPCRAGMPMMKSYYQKYQGKMEIIGIATWDVEEGWKRALSNLQLTWPNVFSYKGTPTDVAAHYAVKGLPTKFLISPKGEILFRYEGEDEQFYQKIDQLIK